MPTLFHLSLSVRDPEHCARVLAEITDGQAIAFKARGLEGAWICLWDPTTNHLVEFLPARAVMHRAPEAAAFRSTDHPVVGGTHLQLQAERGVDHIRGVSESHGCCCRLRCDPRRGGPLLEVWLEEDVLLELVSDDISAACAASRL